MSEYLIRFIAGGLVVSAFSVLSDMLRPKSFAGLLGAAPSVALATLAIAIVQHGVDYAAAESRTMIFGAAALACYSLAVCRLLVRFRFGALPVTIISLAVWLLVAFALLAMSEGAA